MAAIASDVNVSEYPPIVSVGAVVAEAGPSAEAPPLAPVTADMSDHGPLMPNEREPSPSDEPYVFMGVLPAPKFVRHEHPPCTEAPQMGPSEYVYSDDPVPEQYYLCYLERQSFDRDIVAGIVCALPKTPILDEPYDNDTDESDTLALKCAQLQVCPWLAEVGNFMVTYRYVQHEHMPYYANVTVSMNAVTFWSYLEKNKRVIPSIGTVCQLPNAAKYTGWIREITAEERQQIQELSVNYPVHLFYTATLCANNIDKSTIVYLGNCEVYSFMTFIKNNSPDYVIRLP